MLLGCLCLTKLPERMSPETACMLAAFTCSAGRPEGFDLILDQIHSILNPLARPVHAAS